MWNWIIFFIGFIVAILLIILIIGILYYIKSFPFQYCSTPPTCVDGQYFNTPKEQEEAGGDPKNFLFIENGVLYFKRYAKVLGCIPSSSIQTIIIENPDKCKFVLNDKTEVIATNRSFNSEIYEIPVDNGEKIIVRSKGNCIPMQSQPSIVESGSIIF